MDVDTMLSEALELATRIRQDEGGAAGEQLAWTMLQLDQAMRKGTRPALWTLTPRHLVDELQDALSAACKELENLSYELPDPAPLQARIAAWETTAKKSTAREKCIACDAPGTVLVCADHANAPEERDALRESLLEACEVSAVWAALGADSRSSLGAVDYEEAKRRIDGWRAVAGGRRAGNGSSTTITADIAALSTIVERTRAYANSLDDETEVYDKVCALADIPNEPGPTTTAEALRTLADAVAVLLEQLEWHDRKAAAAQAVCRAHGKRMSAAKARYQSEWSTHEESAARLRDALAKVVAP